MPLNLKEISESSELEYLIYFRSEADFGPSTDDVISIIDAQFENETGKRVPACWRNQEEE